MGSASFVMSLKNIEEKLRPREKVSRYGLNHLSDGELLALLLRNGNENESCVQLANRMIEESKGLKGLADLSLQQLMSFKGIGIAKASEIAAAIELSKRISLEVLSEKDVVTGPEILIEWLKMNIGKEKQECFVVIFLDIKNQMIGHEILYRGTASEIQIAINEVFALAIRNNAKKIIVAHNHPTGIVQPSQADDDTTQNLLKAGELLQIQVIDHIIVGGNDYYSYCEEHKMRKCDIMSLI